MQKVLARMRELEAKIAFLEELIESKVTDRHVYTHSTVRGAYVIAGAITFVGVVGLFLFGLFIGWHWGWLVAIGVFGGAAVFGVASEEF